MNLSEMGKLVLVTREMRRRTKVVVDSVDPYQASSAVTWESVTLPTPRAGWIVGERYVKVGYITWDGETGGGFKNEGKPVRVFLVSYWPTTSPVKVPPSGFTTWCEGESLAPHPPGWSPEARKTASAYQKAYPQDRDSSGRFV